MDVNFYRKKMCKEFYLTKTHGSHVRGLGLTSTEKQSWRLSISHWRHPLKISIHAIFLSQHYWAYIQSQLAVVRPKWRAEIYCLCDTDLLRRPPKLPWPPNSWNPRHFLYHNIIQPILFSLNWRWRFRNGGRRFLVRVVQTREGIRQSSHDRQTTHVAASFLF